LAERQEVVSMDCFEGVFLGDGCTLFTLGSNSPAKQMQLKGEAEAYCEPDPEPAMASRS
jgi:hypothetical protein